jgi:hypothetical protein
MQQEEPESQDSGQNKPGGDQPGSVFSQQFHNQPVAARVPAPVAKGIFTTGVLVQDGAYEFVLDFLQGLSRPPQIAGRIVLSPGVMDALVRTMDENLAKFTQTYGPPAPLPTPAPQRRPTIQEIYENFKLPEELWSGTYANSVLVGHGPAEFFMDFITSFYPTAAVSCRVYFAAQQAPRIVDTLRMSLQQYQRKMSGQQNPQPPPNNPNTNEG